MHAACPGRRSVKDGGGQAHVLVSPDGTGDVLTEGRALGEWQAAPVHLPRGRKVPGGRRLLRLGRKEPGEGGYLEGEPSCAAAESDLSVPCCKPSSLLLMNNIGQEIGANLQEDPAPPVDADDCVPRPDQGHQEGELVLVGGDAVGDRDNVGCGPLNCTELGGNDPVVPAQCDEKGDARESQSDEVEGSVAVGGPQENNPEYAESQAIMLEPGIRLLHLSGGGNGSLAEAEHDSQGAQGAGVWSSSSSGPPLRPEEVRGCLDFHVTLSSWNVAGASKKKVADIVSTVVDSDVLAIQEYPKLAVRAHAFA